MARNRKKSKKRKFKKRNQLLIISLETKTLNFNIENSRHKNILPSISLLSVSFSILLWVVFSLLVSLFALIIIFSTDSFKVHTYVFSPNNPAFVLMVLLPVYILALLILYIFEKYKNNDYYTLILHHQISQINFMLPILFAVIFLAIDRMVN